jgi:hypothetical protein
LVRDKAAAGTVRRCSPIFPDAVDEIFTSFSVDAIENVFRNPIRQPK